MCDYWNVKARSARRHCDFSGTLSELKSMVGEPPRIDAYLRRPDVNRPLSAVNFKWEVPRTNQKRDAKSSILEGKRASPGAPCPYHKSEILDRNAWLAGHYDAHGHSAWILARGCDNV